RWPIKVKKRGGETTWPTLTPLIEQAWADGSLPPSVVVMVNVGRGFYMDFKDGSEKWESFYLREFIPFAREKLNGARTADQTVLMGVSMGGMGSLRMAFKNPEMFAAVVALEPALESRTDWDDLTDRDTFYRAGQYERIFGDPIDKAFWQRNHPTWLALTHYKSLRDSGIQIYIEVGDQDMLYLQYGTEALHRALWDNQVPHEYRLVRGADHVGPSLTPRILDALGFAGRALNPPDWNTGKVKRTRAMFKALILRSGNWSFDHKD
ncbi:MAG: alpha/beta hydrolase, partial [Alphaproteobacteria bacterium]